VALCAVLATSAARAADDPFARGIDTVPNKLTPTMNSGLTLEGGELEYRGSWQLQAVLDVNFGVLSMKLGEQPLGSLIPVRTDIHVLGAYQLHPRIEVAADLPVTFYQASDFRLLADQGFPQEEPQRAGLGAPRLLTRVQLLRVSEVPIVSLAAVAELRFPVGDTFSFLSDRGWVFAPRLAAERRFGPVRALATLGWRFRSLPGRYLNLYVGHEFTMGFGTEVELPELWKFKQTRAWAELSLATPAEAPFTFRDAEALKTPLELTVGARAMVSERVGLTVGIGKGLGAPGYGREAFRVLLGVSYAYQGGPDSDGDGVIDRVDQCPGEAETRNGYLDEDGCADDAPAVDSDGDGLPDLVDACPETPGARELDGCPDRDGDQLADLVDKCPDVPGPPDTEGCPPPADEPAVVLESGRIRINNQVLFELGKANIDQKSYKILDEVVTVLLANPDVGPVLIEGHTDNTGPRAFNIDLSNRRAAAVEGYLVKKGVERKRLRSAGFGFDRPVVPNTTPLNRAKNRRTEFRVVDPEETPAGKK
jgi:OOP family OmpA-OmpF porin